MRRRKRAEYLKSWLKLMNRRSPPRALRFMVAVVVGGFVAGLCWVGVVVELVGGGGKRRTSEEEKKRRRA